jgi:hypothetical protein
LLFWSNSTQGTLRSFCSLIGSIQWSTIVLFAAIRLLQPLLIALRTRLIATGQRYTSFIRISHPTQQGITRILQVVTKTLSSPIPACSPFIFPKNPHVLWSDSSGTAAGGVILDIGWLRFPWTQEIIAASTSPNGAIDIVSLEGAALAITAETLARHPSFDPARGISIGIDSESFIRLP